MTKVEKRRYVYITNKQVASALLEYIHYVRQKEKELFNFNAPLFKTQRGSGLIPMCAKMVSQNL
ncbi:hypothetical protein [Legionella tucsonensis]|uniref:Integrase n=1 Tax=Legionella tucsonensis TaxID=40335 RepID=A0A0W0ZU49_9GAMM|nr:hypothetical protein [Legionella tucsonensis]KTD72715.1 hypothetical protein Ltuc_0562 [Legionella tucsonensis]